MDHSDVALYVMTPEFGAATQLEKIDMLDFADVVAINKFDKRGGADALRDVRKQYKRNHELWEAQDDDLPIFGTIASQFNDPGTHRLYRTLMNALWQEDRSRLASTFGADAGESEKVHVIPPERDALPERDRRSVRGYNDWTERQSRSPVDCRPSSRAAELSRSGADTPSRRRRPGCARELDPKNLHWLETWPREADTLRKRSTSSKCAGKEIRIPRPPEPESPDHSQGERARLTGWQDLLRWGLQENVPGVFPFTAGIYPVQARRRGPDAHVRRRGRTGAHEPALPLRSSGHAGQAAVDGV